MAIIKKISSAPVTQAPGENPRVLRFIASSENVDRDGDIIRADGWDLTPFSKNPVFLWSHDPTVPPVGKVVNSFVDKANKNLVCDVQFGSISELSPGGQPSEHAKFVDTIYNLYKNAYLSAVSVGFQPTKMVPVDDGDVDTPDWMKGHDIKSACLYELSAVAIPANPDALVMARSIKSFDMNSIDLVIEKAKNMDKGALPFKHYPLADEDAAWNGPEVISDSEIDDLKIICSWADGSKAEADLAKGDFKLPHHMAKADGYKTVWAGVHAAYGALLGARGGVKIPDADVDAVKAHLAKHYKEFNKDVPEDKAAWRAMEKSIQADQASGMYKSGARLSKDSMTHLDEMEACHKDMEAAHKVMKDSIATICDAHAKAMEAHAKSIKALKALRDGSKPDDSEEPDDTGDDTDDDDGKSFTIEFTV
jgi:hypothetical protein